MSTGPDSAIFSTSGPAPDEFQSDAPTHPGEMLRRVLAARGMTQAELAARTNLSAKHINQVLHGVALMSADVAVALERVLGTPASMWTRLDARWQEERSRDRARDSLSEHTDWAHQFPLKELVSRGLLSGHEQGSNLVDALLGMFRVGSPTAFDRVWLTALQGGFRRAQHFEIDKYSTATWLMLAERQAETRVVGIKPYDPACLRKLLPQLRPLTRLPAADGFAHARQLLAGCGVSLTFVESVAGSRAHGAIWWIAPNRPLIVLSERQKREDTFWFSLFHEISHLLLHPRRTVFVEFEKEIGDDLDGREAEADDFAADIMIPRNHDEQISTLPVKVVPSLADKLDVGVAIVAGRRAHLTDEWRSMSTFRKSLNVAGLRIAADRSIDIATGH